MFDSRRRWFLHLFNSLLNTYLTRNDLKVTRATALSTKHLIRATKDLDGGNDQPDALDVGNSVIVTIVKLVHQLELRLDAVIFTSSGFPLEVVTRCAKNERFRGQFMPVARGDF